MARQWCGGLFSVCSGSKEAEVPMKTMRDFRRLSDRFSALPSPLSIFGSDFPDFKTRFDFESVDFRFVEEEEEEHTDEAKAQT